VIDIWLTAGDSGDATTFDLESVGLNRYLGFPGDFIIRNRSLEIFLVADFLISKINIHYNKKIKLFRIYF